MYWHVIGSKCHLSGFGILSCSESTGKIVVRSSQDNSVLRVTEKGDILYSAVLEMTDTFMVSVTRASTCSDEKAFNAG
jgi:hypothetical protein